MVHNDCKVNPHCGCIIDKKCSKKFPKQFIQETMKSEDGYPFYRRRSEDDGGFIHETDNRIIDNSWIVPYNPYLLR